jgi:uncharacterized protein DUF4432
VSAELPPPELVAHPDQLAAIHRSVVADGPAAGCRAIDVRVLGGIDVRVLPDRGCDIGAAWYRGVPLAWISAVGESGPLDAPAGDDWIRAFGGGLVTTCGRRNVGLPSEGHGLHGAASHQRAELRAVERAAVDDRLAVVIRATMREASALGPCLETERTITTWTGAGRVRVEDRTVNRGRRPEPAPVLYHVNLGAPLWAPGASLDVAARQATVPRDADAEAAREAWFLAPEPDETPERVFEHELATGAATGSVRVEQPALGLAVDVRWDRATLPRLHQWLHTAEGAYVLGIEPANCSVLGRAADREAGRLPVLAPGEERRTSVEIRVAPAAPR